MPAAPSARRPSESSDNDQTGHHEGEEADHDPVSLLSPKFRCDRIVAHVGRAVDRDYAEDRQGQHVGEQKPVEAQQFSQKRRHVIGVFVVPFGRDRSEIICTFARYVKRQLDPFSTGNGFTKRNAQTASWLDLNLSQNCKFAAANSLLLDSCNFEKNISNAFPC
jgi:hypothetical protein